MTTMVVKRGDIFYADLSPVIGSEQGGIRPVIIIQNDIGNKYSPTVIVAAITSQINKAKLPTHVEISSEEYGLNRDSVVLLEQIRTLDKKRLKEKSYKIPMVIPIVLYTGKRKWNKLLINDIEEKIDGYAKNWLEYTLIDVNKFSKEELLADNLIITKAMLIEKSKNKEELYKNIEDVINMQKERRAFNNLQLEKLIAYELSGTEDKNIMHEFIEKIRDIEGSEEIMTNASRIINREIRKERKAGLEQGIQQGLRQGIALVAKKLKGKMEIKDISQITGLSETEIENL